MVQIQVQDGAELRERGERQASSHVELAAQRGAIYDRAGGDPAEVATALEDYAAVLRKAGDDVEAEKLETRARTLRDSIKKSDAAKP